ncbi:MAG: OmpH family outer membrane protein [Prevotellaceae bacterium]|jgi:outer membrane protein|nr:OmpH family outer membrane protein [Prevotellaceae bacterium]
MKKIFIFTMTMSLILSSCGSNSSNIERTTSDSIQGELPVLKAEKGDIVFVRMDSIVNNFDMYHDLRRVYEDDVTKAENEMKTKVNTFQRDAKSLQEKFDKGLLTRSQAEEEQSRLYRRQQSIEEEQVKLRNELGEKEMVLLNQIQDAIMTYVNKYNEEKAYSMIISTTGNSTVLYGNPGLDITHDIIKGLNEEYIKNR